MAEASSASIRKVAGWLALSVVATLLFGVFALWLTDRANSQQVADFNRILQVVDATRQAQVRFKTQVQEWKNVLLRGQVASDYERYLGQFHIESGLTIEQLNRAQSVKTALGIAASDVAAALAAHSALMRQYEDGLRGYEKGNVASVFAVDAAVRGRDRQLNEMIDAIADAMGKEADRRMAILTGENHSRYQILRAVFIALAAGTMLLAGWLAVLTLRRRSAPHAA